jgi:hypothetical protein
MEASMDISPQRTTLRLNPLAPVARSWRRLRRRPALMQWRTVGLIVAVVVALIVWLAMAPSGVPGGSTPAGAAEATLAFTPTPVTQASTSTRGVTATTINIAFPVVDINSQAGKFGFATDKEYGQQVNAIHLYVNQINQSGGIDGRKINPIIDQFDPTNDANMQSLCDQWTQGSPGVFAVIDGIGTWEGDQQLCVTQQGHTPLLSAWSTVTDWTQLGSPYLWWTGADDVPLFKALIKWGMSSGRLSKGKKVGVVVSDQAADQAALNSYLVPELKKVGITPAVVAVVAGNPADTSSTDADAQLAVEKLKAAGVQSVIPLVPANAFIPYIGQENSQKYYPQLLLSDYQSTVEVALGLIPVPYETALNGQEGVTTETLGNNVDDNRPESQGGYDPGVRSCYNTWHTAHPGPIAGTSPPTHFIEEQGPIQAWCGAIRLFAQAAKGAGKNLNRRTFVEAMSKVTNFTGTLSPVWSYSPTKMYGPTEYQVVKIHNNVPPSSQCQLTTFHKAQGTCWVVQQSWQPLPS